MSSEIIIAPCTREKIWDIQPDRGEVAARDAYIKPAFVKWRQFSEDSELPWLILSTKYGFLKPDQLISKYEAKVSRAKRDPAYVMLLQKQAESLQKRDKAA